MWLSAVSLSSVSFAHFHTHRPRTVAHSRDHTTPQMPCRSRGSLARIILPGDAGYQGLCAERRKLIVDGQLLASSPTCRRGFTGPGLVRHRVRFGHSLPCACCCNTNEHPAKCLYLESKPVDRDAECVGTSGFCNRIMMGPFELWPIVALVVTQFPNPR